MKILIAMLSAALSLCAADFRGVPATPAGFRSNIESLQSRRFHVRKTGRTKSAIALPGDNICSTIISSSTMDTTFSIVNMSAAQSKVNLYFFSHDGADLALPVAGSGELRSAQVAVAPFETFRFSSEMTGDSREGWALIEPEDPEDLVSGYCMITSRIPDTELSMEFTLPVVNRFYTRAVMPYDNTPSGYSSVQLVNATPKAQVITVNLNSNGLQQTKSWRFEPWQGYNIAIDKLFDKAVPERGTLELISDSPYGFGATGIRWGSLSISALPVLTTVDWYVSN
jgi:hypothetical protein